MYAAAAAGLLRVEVATHPASSRYNQPAGTESRTVEYIDPDGQRVLLTHEFRLPDGRIGASGKPDPKFFLYKGVGLKLAKRR